jgi:SagB-type dehydrogenase family enzyme
MAGVNLLITGRPSVGKTTLVMNLVERLRGSLGAAMIQSKSGSSHIVRLPPPEQKGKVSLEEALARRRSVREFRRDALTERELSQLLWAAQGVTHPEGLRTAPSAGALYPLQLYVASATGFYCYEARPHHLVGLSDRDLRTAVRGAALDSESITQAPAVFVITAAYEATSRKYGAARTFRYIHMEVGHAAQNLLLEAVTLGLGGAPIGAFEDEALQRVLALPVDQHPLYLVPVGHPR